MNVPHEMLGTDKVVISLKDFENMLDLIAYDQSKPCTEEMFPATLTIQLIEGTSPLKAFRKHRGLSQSALGELSGIGQGLISEIESGKKQGSIDTLKALSDALNVDIGDLL